MIIVIRSDGSAIDYNAIFSDLSEICNVIDDLNARIESEQGQNNSKC